MKVSNAICDSNSTNKGQDFTLLLVITRVFFVYLDPNSGPNFGLTQPNFALTQPNFGLTQQNFPPNSNFRRILVKIVVLTHKNWQIHSNLAKFRPSLVSQKGLTQF